MIAYPNTDYKRNIELIENLLQKRSKNVVLTLANLRLKKIHSPDRWVDIIEVYIISFSIILLGDSELKSFDFRKACIRIFRVFGV